MRACAGPCVGLLFVFGALLACKKKEEPPAPPAPPAAPVAPTPEPTTVSPATATPEAGAAATAAPSPDPSPSPVAPAPNPAPSATGVASARPANPAAPILACCSALEKAAKDKPEHASRYKSAASVCAGIAQQVKKGTANPSTARTTLRAQIQGVPVPAGC